MTHVGGGSHGALETVDSLVPLLTVGLEPGVRGEHEQWRISDVADIVSRHFGLNSKRGQTPLRNTGASLFSAP
jgi:hypothetical protein